MKGDTFRRHVRDGKNEGGGEGNAGYTRVHRARTLASSLAFLVYVGKKGEGELDGNGGMWWGAPFPARA